MVSIIAVGSAVYGHVTALKSVSMLSSLIGDSDHWQRFPVRQIEDLRNLVLGADLETFQMPGGRVGGSLAFSAFDGVIFSSGLIDGNAMTKGVLAKDAATVGIVVSQGGGCRVCLSGVLDGAIGIVLPGHEFDALCAPGAMYVTATLELERLEDAVACKFSKSAMHPKPLVGDRLNELKSALLRVHSGEVSVGDSIGNMVLKAILSHGLSEGEADTNRLLSRHEAAVRAACSYIDHHLAHPMTVTDVASASGSSRRTLYRAFLDVLGETPNHYVRRLRLHRIRRDLIAGDRFESISTSARRWGITEHGRMSGWYQEVFGEKPSATVASRPKRDLSEAWL